jgi:hypothetical protein
MEHLSSFLQAVKDISKIAFTRKAFVSKRMPTKLSLKYTIWLVRELRFSGGRV